MSLLLSALGALLWSANPVAPVGPQDVFWSRLQALCESAVAGRLVSAPPGDTQIDPNASLVVHFWECGERELRQEFVTERNSMRGGWAVEVVPGERFTYGTIRAGEWRHQLAFDLAAPVPVPPRHWGADRRPSQRP
jgi:hypothetical protein